MKRILLAHPRSKVRARTWVRLRDITRRAARGDAKALKQFFTIAEDVDGAAAEMHLNVPTAVDHILGDEKFAKFLGAQPLAYRVMVRNSILNDGLTFPQSHIYGAIFRTQPRLCFAAKSSVGFLRTSVTRFARFFPTSSI